MAMVIAIFTVKRASRPFSPTLICSTGGTLATVRIDVLNNPIIIVSTLTQNAIIPCQHKPEPAQGWDRAIATSMTKLVLGTVVIHIRSRLLLFGRG